MTRREDLLTLVSGNQGVHRVRSALAQCFKLPPERVRVICPDVGGGFGPRTNVYPEQVAVLFAARRLGRPVKWTSDRSEAFLTDYQGRDFVTEAKLALDRSGRMLALAIDHIGNVGAHTVSLCAVQQCEPDRDHALRHPGGACARARRDDQYGVDLALSRRRPAGGDARRRAADRSRGGEARHRPARAAPQQHDPARAIPLSHGHGTHLRRRRLRRQHGARARHGRLGRFPGAPQGGRTRAAGSPASASPTTSSRRWARRTSASASRCAPTASSRFASARRRSARATRPPMRR